MDEETSIPVLESDIKEFLQYFFNSTKLAMDSEQELQFNEEEWSRVIRRFKKVFPKSDHNQDIYIVDDKQLFTFINEETTNYVETILLEMVDEGMVEMLLDPNGELIFREKK